MAIKKSRKGAALDEPLVKKRIRLVISRKKRLLAEVSCDEENLRRELMAIKHLYDSTIGVLYLKIDDLDESIFALKKLRDLLEKDMSLAEARRTLEERARAEEGKRSAEEERLHTEYARMMARTAHTPAQGAELKKLWRKLAFRFHPDLVQDDAEKKERESMMQKVNDAYGRGDLVALRLLDEEDNTAVSDVDNSMEDLEQALLDIESSLKRIKQKIVALKRSEWYTWREKIDRAEKEERNLLKELEKKLQYQARIREKTISELKKELGVS